MTFPLQSYLVSPIIIYNAFLGTERWIVLFRIDLRQWKFKFSEMPVLDSFARLKLAEIVSNCTLRSEIPSNNAQMQVWELEEAQTLVKLQRLISRWQRKCGFQRL